MKLKPGEKTPEVSLDKLVDVATGALWLRELVAMALWLRSLTSRDWDALEHDDRAPWRRIAERALGSVNFERPSWADVAAAVDDVMLRVASPVVLADAVPDQKPESALPYPFGGPFVWQHIATAPNGVETWERHPEVKT